MRKVWRFSLIFILVYIVGFIFTLTMAPELGFLGEVFFAIYVVPLFTLFYMAYEDSSLGYILLILFLEFVLTFFFVVGIAATIVQLRKKKRSSEA